MSCIGTPARTSFRLFTESVHTVQRRNAASAAYSGVRERGIAFLDLVYTELVKLFESKIICFIS